jgi:hypothetical protein
VKAILPIIFCLACFASPAQDARFKRIDSLIERSVKHNVVPLIKDSASFAGQPGPVFFYYDSSTRDLAYVWVKDHARQQDLFFYYANNALRRVDLHYTVYDYPKSYYFLEKKVYLKQGLKYKLVKGTSYLANGKKYRQLFQKYQREKILK